MTPIHHSGTVSEASPIERSLAKCGVCTIRLERLCYSRALWFRAFRNVLAAFVRAWSLLHPVDAILYANRASACRGCLRLRKNVLKARSPIFRWIDGYVNPLFNRARDSLLRPGELEAAKVEARDSEVIHD